MTASRPIREALTFQADLLPHRLEVALHASTATDRMSGGAGVGVLASTGANTLKQCCQAGIYSGALTTYLAGPRQGMLTEVRVKQNQHHAGVSVRK